MIQLTKGQNVKLTKGVKNVRVGLSWDPINDGKKLGLGCLSY